MHFVFLSFQVAFEPPDFHFVFIGIGCAAHQAEALEHEIGVGGVGFAVVADFAQAAFVEGLPYLAAVHAQLAGEAAQLGHVV